MLVQRIQSQTNGIRTYIKKAASKTANKLSNVRFDIRSNKLVAEPYKDLFQVRCGNGDGTYTIVCDNEPVDIMIC